MNYHNAGRGGAPGRGSSSGVSRPPSKKALIVAASPVSRIVIGRTIEWIYLRSDAVAPDEALDALRRRKHALVIIDAPLENPFIEQLLSDLVRRRNASEKKLPRIIVVADPVKHRPSPHDGVIDAVVSKPITPEALQPVVQRLMAEGGA